jgi:hypothetical protein
MAAPIKSAAHIPGVGQLDSPPRTGEFLLSDEGSFSRDVIQIPQGAAMWPGTIVDAAGAPVAAGAEATAAGILLYAVNPTDGPVNATVVTRHAEVTDAYLQYGGADPVAINTALAAKGIIVRDAVLKNVMPAGFAPDEPPAGPPVSGIP